MAWWEQSEYIYFDWVLSDLFDWLGAYENAFYKWSDEKWKSEFENKLVLRAYSEDINVAVRKEFQRFLKCRPEEIAIEKAENEEKYRKEEQEKKEIQEHQEKIDKLYQSFHSLFLDFLEGVFEDYMEMIDLEWEKKEKELGQKFQKYIFTKVTDGLVSEKEAEELRKNFKTFCVETKKEEEQWEKISKKKEREKSRQEAELERKRTEKRLREQRKIKQLPQVTDLIKRMEEAKAEVAQKASTENYRKVIAVCYCAITNWSLLSCLDEFGGIWEYYEKCVLEYLDIEDTMDGLYQTVLYYTNQDIVWKINDLTARKHHLNKGLPYVKLLFETLKDEESAEKYVNCYLQLFECCSTGEDLEALSYADKAYKLAKSFAFQFGTQDMLEQVETAMLELTAYYREHGQDIEAEEIGAEFIEIKNKLQ